MSDICKSFYFIILIWKITLKIRVIISQEYTEIIYGNFSLIIHVTAICNMH